MRRAFLLLAVVFAAQLTGCDTLQKKHESPVMVAAPRRLEKVEPDESELKYASKDEKKKKTDETATDDTADIEQTSATGRKKRSTKNPWEGWQDDTTIFNSQVAATVNGAPVLNGEVLDAWTLQLLNVRTTMQKIAGDPKLQQPGQRIPTPDDYVKYREQAIQMSIEVFIQKRMLVERLKSGLKPDQVKMMNSHIDEQFEKEIGNLKQQLKVSNKTELELALREKGTSLQNVKDNFALERLAMECIAIKSEKADPIERPDLVAYYKANEEKFRIPARVRWQQIQVSIAPPGNDAKKREARDKIELALDQLQSGVSFDEVARKYSDGPTAKKGGDWGWLEADTLADTNLEKLLFSMRAGKISKIHEGPSSYSVVKVLEKQEAGHKPFEDLQDEIRSILQKEQDQKRLEKFKQEIFATAVVETKYQLKSFNTSHE